VNKFEAHHLAPRTRLITSSSRLITLRHEEAHNLKFEARHLTPRRGSSPQVRGSSPCATNEAHHLKVVLLPRPSSAIYSCQRCSTASLERSC
jgi:hypothetical protein